MPSFLTVISVGGHCCRSLDCSAVLCSFVSVLKGLTGQHDSCAVRMWYFLSLYSLALISMSLRDFPLLYDKRGSSLKISFNRGWFCLRYRFSLSICLTPDSARQYRVTNGSI